jgi:hypothetical protein
LSAELLRGNTALSEQDECEGMSDSFSLGNGGELWSIFVFNFGLVFNFYLENHPGIFLESITVKDILL